ncbi:MAG: hypothetical protein PHE79_07125 [Eubacteriales bacterium]|nr:hypothetical protein [Eubacteriales bacterium]
MRGNEIINHIVRAEMPDMDQVRGKCVQQEISQKQHKKRPRFRSAVTLATTAAVVICFLLGNMLLNPHGDNVFFVKAYAMEQQADGSIGLREVDVVDQPDTWGGYFDGENFYVSVGLKYEGENIKSVDFTAAEGFFAKQYINNLSDEDEEDILKMYVGADNRLVMAGEDFEIAGDRITFDDETMTDDLLLFWGIEASDMSEVPKKIEISARATFNDDKTQELLVTINLSGTGIYTGVISEEESQRLEKQHEYYDNFPLEQCEFIPESVKPVTDVYEFEFGGSGARFDIVENEMEFYEDGIFRCGRWGSDEGWIITVIKRDSNGALTGMSYKVG